MKKLTWQLLKFLADGEWHLQPPKGVGPKTVDLCVHRGWVQTKRVPIERKARLETFFMPVRLTKLGRIIYLNEKSRQTGRVPRELRDHRLRELRKILGAGVVRSLQKGTAVFRVWRRSTPYNWWVENRRGEELWHSHEGGRPNPYVYLDLVKHSPRLVGTGIPLYTGIDGNSPEDSTYRLKKCYC